MSAPPPVPRTRSIQEFPEGITVISSKPEKAGREIVPRPSNSRTAEKRIRTGIKRITGEKLSTRRFSALILTRSRYEKAER